MFLTAFKLCSDKKKRTFGQKKKTINHKQKFDMKIHLSVNIKCDFFWCVKKEHYINF